MKKTTQSDINKVLWKAADTFRGTLNSTIYKDYILVMLFVKYMSDVYKEHYEEFAKKYNNDEKRIERALSRERFILNNTATFDFLYKNRNKVNIGQLINEALESIEESNKSKLRLIFRNTDFNSEVILGKPKEKNPLLRTLLEDFNELDLRPGQLEGNDVIGDAYEYMIAQFASDAGRKGGEFFTPSMVSELLACLVKPEENDRIYDPTCGSGSLLIKAFKKVPAGKAQIYGQEKNGQTHSLCKMNMFLHGIDDAKIENGDTLSNPLHLKDGKLMKFQVIVANPPFSLDKWAMGFAGAETEGSGKDDDTKKFKMEAALDIYNRFDFGVPPASKGDYAFILHMLKSLDENGRMAVVMPHGVLFRGASEGKIRKRILEENLLDAVIGLPENLFFGTGIPAAILVFKKNRKKDDVLFVDASHEYEKDKNQNVLRQCDIEKILDAYERFETIDKYSYKAAFKEIEENDFNLNIPRYVDMFEEEEMIDMDEVANNIYNIKKELSDVENEMNKYLKELGLC